MGRSLSSANSTFMLGAVGVFSDLVKIEGYSADSAWTMDDVTLTKTTLGVDGSFAAAWIPYTTTMTLSLMPNSSSNDFFERILSYQDVIQEAVELFGNIQIPSIGRKYALENGVISKMSLIPSTDQTLKAKKIVLIWGKCTVSVV